VSEERKSFVRKGLIATGAVVLLGGVAAVLYSKSVSSKDKGLKTVAVTKGTVVEKALAVGSIRPRHEIAVKSKISGIVRKSYREVGDHVNAGDPLFEILPDPTPLELTESRREVEIAKNIYDQAKKRSDRARALRAQGILSNTFRSSRSSALPPPAPCSSFWSTRATRWCLSPPTRRAPPSPTSRT
jgi:multidrug efflux pump subunit AcrA (membrane-fusion protein)